MGTITVSMQNDDEEKLRKLALKRFGRTKGALSKVISEAINLVEKEGVDQDKKFLELARKGLHLGKVDIKKIREGMYGRHKGV